MIVIVLPDVQADEQLLDSARRNDTDASREIYERYFDPIYQFIRLRVNDVEQARDIAADVFVDFFVAVRKGKGPTTHLRAWLFRVARNKIYDYYGQRKRVTMTALEDSLPALDDDPEAEVIESLRRQRVRQMLGILADEQQEVLILRFGQGLSLQETADLMDKSVSAVKSLQFRAVDRLRQLLDVEEGNG
jgi:RNA polymerase sigma-70 factor (ECF subfamily)